MTDIEKKLVSDMDTARKQLTRLNGVKGQGAEREYAICYDKLALIGGTNRQRLRRKYRP